MQGGDGGRTVDLAEGKVTSIKIEVSAEDGTTKQYTIQAKRLSAKDASLTTIKMEGGCLIPDFNPDVFSYTCRCLPSEYGLILVLHTFSIDPNPRYHGHRSQPVSLE